MKNFQKYILIGAMLLVCVAPRAFVFAADVATAEKEAALAELNQQAGLKMNTVEALAYCDKAENREACVKIGIKYHLLSANAEEVRIIAEGVRDVCEKGSDEAACADAVNGAIKKLEAMTEPEAVKVAEILRVNAELMTIARGANDACNKATGPEECIVTLNGAMAKLGAGKQAANPEAKRISGIMAAQVKIFSAIAGVRQACGGESATPEGCLGGLKAAKVMIAGAVGGLPKPEGVTELIKNIDAQISEIEAMMKQAKNAGAEGSPAGNGGEGK